jgi:hypothetical protein
MKKRIKNLINRYFNKLPTPAARCWCIGSDICVIDTYRLSASGYPYETFYDKDTGICYIAIGNGVTPLYNKDGTLKIHKESK